MKTGIILSIIGIILSFIGTYKYIINHGFDNIFLFVMLPLFILSIGCFICLILLYLNNDNNSNKYNYIKDFD